MVEFVDSSLRPKHIVTRIYIPIGLLEATFWPCAHLITYVVYIYSDNAIKLFQQSFRGTLNIYLRAKY